MVLSLLCLLDDIQFSERFMPLHKIINMIRQTCLKYLVKTTFLCPSYICTCTLGNHLEKLMKPLHIIFFHPCLLQHNYSLPLSPHSLCAWFNMRLIIHRNKMCINYHRWKPCYGKMFSLVHLMLYNGCL